MKNDLDFAGGLMNKLPSVNSFSMRSEFRATINKVIQNLDKHVDLANRASHQKVFEIATCPDDKIEGTVEQGSNSFGAVGVYKNTFSYNRYKLGTKNLGNAFLSAPADAVQHKSLSLNDADLYSQFPITEVMDPSGNQVKVFRMISAADIETMWKSTNFYDDYSGDVIINQQAVDKSNYPPSGKGITLKNDFESSVTILEDYEKLRAEVFVDDEGHNINLLAHAAKNNLAVLLLNNTVVKVLTPSFSNYDVLSIASGAESGACAEVRFYYINKVSTKAALSVENHDRTAIQPQNCPENAPINKLLKTLAELNIDATRVGESVNPENETDYLCVDNAINYVAVVSAAQNDIDVLINRNAVMTCAIKTNRKFLQSLYDNVHGNSAFAANSYANLCDC